MDPQPCQVCEKCGTAPGYSTDSHPEPMAHEWVPQFDQSTGKPKRPYCRRCYERGPLPTPENTETSNV